MEGMASRYAQGRPMNAPEDEWKAEELGSSVGTTISSSDDGVRQKDVDAVLNAAYGEGYHSAPLKSNRNGDDCNQILPWWKRLLKKLGIVASLSIAALPSAVIASTWYVRCNGGLDSNDGKTRESAFSTLSKAISTAARNDTIILGDGIYEIVRIEKVVRLLSENGYANTVIDCSQVPDPLSYAPSASLGSYFNGITFRNGCVLWLGCSGGNASSTIDSCCIENFTNSQYFCGIVHYGIAKNCIFRNNTASAGGLLSWLTAYNCTIVQNNASGAGVTNWSTLYNCIMYSNTGAASWATISNFNNCYTDNPKFMNEAGGNYKLAEDSPCRNAGNNSYAVGMEFDLAGNTRVAEDCVDIGAFEYIPYFTVTFDVGEHGYISSGDANQIVDNGACPIAPTVVASNGWKFVHWSPDPTVAVESNVTYIAEYIRYQCEKPSVSPASGSFSDVSVEVSMVCATEDSEIYYTLDGSTPSQGNGHRYTAPFLVFKTTTVKAIAMREDWVDSAIVDSTYEREDAIGEAANLLQYPMENDETYLWTVDTEISHDGVSAIKSGGERVKNVVSAVSTSVKRAGTVRFWWKADCEESEDGEYYDYLAFIVDDEVVDRLAGHDAAWKKVKYEIPTGGKHVLRWEYRKDGATSRYSDCGWVDQIEWIPADDSGHTVTTIKPVPYAWLQKFNFGNDTDFETAAISLSGKTQSGIATSVFDEFWIGTDPTNQNSKLIAVIDMTNNVPIIRWIPDLSTNDMRRTYNIWGKARLDEGGEWICPTNSTHHFFKVTVEMP